MNVNCSALNIQIEEIDILRCERQKIWKCFAEEIVIPSANGKSTFPFAN